MCGAVGSSSPLKISEFGKQCRRSASVTISLKTDFFKVFSATEGSGDADGDGTYSAMCPGSIAVVSGYDG